MSKLKIIIIVATVVLLVYLIWEFVVKENEDNGSGSGSGGGSPFGNGILHSGSGSGTEFAPADVQPVHNPLLQPKEPAPIGYVFLEEGRDDNGNEIYIYKSMMPPRVGGGFPLITVRPKYL
jgi:hypothetical protein